MRLFTVEIAAELSWREFDGLRRELGMAISQRRGVDVAGSIRVADNITLYLGRGGTSTHWYLYAETEQGNLYDPEPVERTLTVIRNLTRAWGVAVRELPAGQEPTLPPANAAPTWWLMLALGAAILSDLVLVLVGMQYRSGGPTCSDTASANVCNQAMLSTVLLGLAVLLGPVVGLVFGVKCWRRERSGAAALAIFLSIAPFVGFYAILGLALAGIRMGT